MKRLITLLMLAAIVQLTNSQDNYCDPSTNDEVNNFQMNDGAQWLKDFNVYVNKCCSDKAKEVSYKMVLTKNKNYRFVVKNSPRFSGKMKIDLADENGKVILAASTIDNNPKAFDIVTSITCPYTLKITYPNSEEGCGAIAIFFVKDL